MSSLDTLNSQIGDLLSSLCDAEVCLYGEEEVISALAAFVSSEDKRVAQSAAFSLWLCGGTAGSVRLQTLLAEPGSLPHQELLENLVRLLAAADKKMELT